MFNLYIIHNGIKNIPMVLDGVKWSFIIGGSHGTLNFSFLFDGKTKFDEGDIVTLYQDKNPVFYGRIFNFDRDDRGVVNITAYDNLRYFRNSNSYSFYQMTASKIITRLIDDIKVPRGEIDDTFFIIPHIIETNSSPLNIAVKALEYEKKRTGKDYILYCDFDKICLKDSRNMNLSLTLTEKNTAEFLYSSSISSCYNQIKLTRQSNSGTESYLVKNSELENKWGVLQFHERVGSDVDMAGRAQELLNGLSIKKTTFRIGKAFGDIRVRAGSRIGVEIELKQYHGAIRIAVNTMVLSVVHEICSGRHFMTLELEIPPDESGIII